MVPKERMVEESLRIFILRNYIRRIWTWLEFFGIAALILGAIVLYDQVGFLEPIRSHFNDERLRWWSIVAFSATAGCVAGALMIGWLAGRNPTVKVDLPRSNPHEKSELDHESAIVAALLSRFRALESIVWMLAVLPAFWGAALFVMGRPMRIMLLYMGITLTTAVIFIPSIERTERIIDRCLDKYRKSLPSEK